MQATPIDHAGLATGGEGAKISVPIPTHGNDPSALRQGVGGPAAVPGAECNPVSPLACSCDFTLPCASLPPCCASNAATSATFDLACRQLEDQAWADAEVGVSQTIEADPSGVYLRYHPSTTSRCRGFMFTLRVPYNTTSSQQDTTVYQYDVAVSFSNPIPSNDPDADHFTFTGNPWHAGSHFPMFCPRPLQGAQKMVGASPMDGNDRTVFFQVSSTTVNSRSILVSVPATFTLFETNDIRDFDLIPVNPQSRQQIQPSQTFVAQLDSVDNCNDLFATYTHTLSECANVILSCYGMNAADWDLYFVHRKLNSAPQ